MNVGHYTEAGDLAPGPGVVDHDIDTPVGLHGCVHQSLDLIEVRDVCWYSESLAATAGQLFQTLLQHAIRARRICWA